jgi:hypothetical protein
MPILEKRDYPVLFLIIGMIIGYFLAFHYAYTYQLPEIPYEWKTRKFYSKINETRIIEKDNYTISLKVQTYFDKSWRMSNENGLPIFVNFTITNHLNEIQWLDVETEYLQIHLFNSTDDVGRIIYTSDRAAGVSGLFLAPWGSHSDLSFWAGRWGGRRLNAGDYFFKIVLGVGGEEIILDEFSFSVENRSVKVYDYDSL